MTGIIATVVDLLIILGIAIGVRIVASHVKQLSYPVILTIVGFGAGAFGLKLGTLRLSHDLILTILIPVIIFHGAVMLDFDQVRKNLVEPLVLVFIGLPLSVVLLGWLGQFFFPLPLLISLLFASIIFPVDPVSVLSLFREMNAPKRLEILAEIESLLDDGLAIVVFSALFEVLRHQQQIGGTLTGIFSPKQVGSIVFDIVFVSAGGAVVGLILGYIVSRFLVVFDKKRIAFVFTLFLAYGGFVLSEHFLGVNGIITDAVAGLFIGTHGKHALKQETYKFVRHGWDIGVFLVNTIIYLVIGIQVPFSQLKQNLDLIAIATVLVLGVRAIEVYSLVGILNRFLPIDISLKYQHILFWGGIHTVIPIALVLSLPPTVPFFEQIVSMVWGVAIITIIVQGLLMAAVLRVTGVTSPSVATGSPEEASDRQENETLGNKNGKSSGELSQNSESKNRSSENSDEKP